MDIDPLADTVPPRHAVESDEEEDEYNPLSTSTQSKSQVRDVEVNIVGDVKDRVGGALVIVTGEAGKVWTRSGTLGEQSGAVMVNQVQVGLLFSPAWTKASVLVSEATVRLPVWAMYSYADVVLETLKPSSLALLDTYATPAYISADPVPFYGAPIRYLRTKGFISVTPNIHPFAPPNLILSTSASFISIFSTLSPSLTQNPKSAGAGIGTLILLPIPHIPPPPPSSIIAPPSISNLGDESRWEPGMVREAQRVLFGAIGEVGGEWEAPSGVISSSGRDNLKVGKRGDLGEGGTYI